MCLPALRAGLAGLIGDGHGNVNIAFRMCVTNSRKTKNSPDILAMEENRTSKRRSTIKAGKAILSASTLMNCVIRDVSAGGARLEFDGPSRFHRNSSFASFQPRLKLPWSSPGNEATRQVCDSRGL
jgi:hypothetical protein